MRKTTYTESAHTATTAQPLAEASPPATNGLPNRLMTAFEVAEFIGCHEETVRRAYLRGLLVSQRFGVRGRRFHPADVLDWIRRGAPTRVS
jgi:excisionase family DNA binding protein